MRSTVGRFNIVIMPFFVVVMGVLVARDVTGPVLGLDRSSLVFLGIQVGSVPGAVGACIAAVGRAQRVVGGSGPGPDVTGCKMVEGC